MPLFVTAVGPQGPFNCLFGIPSMFTLGQLVATPGALALLHTCRLSPITFTLRHVTGDFGELGRHDRQANLHAIEHGLRIVSKYRITANDAIYVITEADRSCTCILLPKEY